MPDDGRSDTTLWKANMARFTRQRKTSASPISSSVGNQAPAQTKPLFSELKAAYNKYADASITKRIQAMFEALAWWDSSMLYFLSKGPLSAEASKKYALATKTRATGVGTGATDPERELALTRTLQFYEKVWADAATPKFQTYMDLYEENKVELEKKEAAFADKYKEILGVLNDSFSGFNLSFEVHDSPKDRAFDGIDKIIISKELAKTLYAKLKAEGVIPVCFSEFNTVIKSASFERDQEGKSVFSYKEYVRNVPRALESIMNYLSTEERRKVFKAAPATVQASSVQPPPIKKHHVMSSRAVNVGAGAKTMRPPLPVPNSARVGGRYQPSSAMAVLYQRLSDGKQHDLPTLLAGLGVSNPEGRLQWIVKHGLESGQWTVHINKTHAQMTIH